jgi:hypothetical protein
VDALDLRKCDFGERSSLSEEKAAKEARVKKIKCFDIPGETVGEVLDDFNERREEWPVQDADIISISTRSSCTEAHNIVAGKKTVKAKVIVTIFYWSDSDA